MSDLDPEPELDFTGERKRLATVALFMLVGVNVMNQVDRQIMSVLVEPVREDLGLSDTQIGLLVGLAFALFYTFAGLPIARLADRGNRRKLIVVSLTLWSGMTAVCGFAQNFVQLLLARVGVGVGEAGCAPAAQSLISDYFPPSHRARSLATYQLGVPIGIFVGSVVGGTLSDVLPWRQVFFVFGAPGLLLALVTYFVLKEPARGSWDGQSDSDEVEPISQVLRFLWSLPAMRHILIAASLHTLTLSAQVTFNFAFLTRVHGLTGAQAGWAIGLLNAVFGTFGTYMGGWIGDRLGPRDARWYIWSLGLGAIASIPFSVFAYITESATLAVVALSLGVIGSYMYAGAVHAVSQSLAKPRMRAMSAAIMLFSMNLFGYGFGPPLAGVLSDILGGEGALRYALAGMNIVLLWSCLHYWLSARTYREDLRVSRAA
ncbi:MAG: spinster family MFS transporter [Myxococcota bacterium]